MASTLELLRQTPYFTSLTHDELRKLTARLHERQFAAGEMIFHKGERCAGLCVVLRGRVRTMTTSAEGREQVLKIFGPGRTFADIPAFDDEPCPADAVADEPSTIALIPRPVLLDVLERHPQIALDVIRLFASRLRAYKQLVEDLSLRDVTGRLARLLVDRARGRSTIVEDSADANPSYTQAEMARLVGSVREVVQRALKALERAGLIELTRGRIRVVDVEALDAWTDLIGAPASRRLGPRRPPAPAEVVGHPSSSPRR